MRKGCVPGHAGRWDSTLPRHQGSSIAAGSLHDGISQDEERCKARALEAKGVAAASVDRGFAHYETLCRRHQAKARCGHAGTP